MMPPVAAPLSRLIKSGVVRVHSGDFDCTVCGRNYDLSETKKLSVATFIVAHVKSCLLRRASQE